MHQPAPRDAAEFGASALQTERIAHEALDKAGNGRAGIKLCLYIGILCRSNEISTASPIPCPLAGWGHQGRGDLLDKNVLADRGGYASSSDTCQIVTPMPSAMQYQPKMAKRPRSSMRTRTHKAARPTTKDRTTPKVRCRGATEG